MVRKFTQSLLMLAGLLGLLTACGSTPSDAARIMQNNSDSTVTALSSTLAAAQVTMTAIGGVSARLATSENDLATERSKELDLLTQLNVTTPIAAAQAQPNTVPLVAGSTSAPANTGSTGSAPAGSTPGTVSGSGITLDPPVTAKNIDGSGCPLGTTTTFSATDQKIWVVAKAHNLKKGVVFTASWSGNFQHQDTWASTYASAQTCVHFYIEPKTLNMTSGSWTVSISTPDIPAASASFTIAAGAAGAAPPTSAAGTGANSQPS